MLLGILMANSFCPGARGSFKYLLFRHYLTIHYMYMPFSINFSVLVELNNSFDVDVLSFVIERVTWI